MLGRSVIGRVRSRIWKGGAINFKGEQSKMQVALCMVVLSLMPRSSLAGQPHSHTRSESGHYGKVSVALCRNACRTNQIAAVR